MSQPMAGIKLPPARGAKNRPGQTRAESGGAGLIRCEVVSFHVAVHAVRVRHSLGNLDVQKWREDLPPLTARPVRYAAFRECVSAFQFQDHLRPPSAPEAQGSEVLPIPKQTTISLAGEPKSMAIHFARHRNHQGPHMGTTRRLAHPVLRTMGEIATQETKPLRPRGVVPKMLIDLREGTYNCPEGCRPACDSGRVDVDIRSVEGRNRSGPHYDILCVPVTVHEALVVRPRHEPGHGVDRTT